MEILRIGITYNNTPVSIREKVSFSKDDRIKATKLLQNQKSILENVIISTCNRTEIFALVDQVHTGKYYIKHFIADWFDIEYDIIKEYFEIDIAENAIEYLFLLACGMKSQVIGETQILGQVKDAYKQSLAQKSTGTIFNHLFQQVLSYAKNIHTTYGLNDKPRSVPYQVFNILKEDIKLSSKSILIIGLGEIGQIMLKNIQNIQYGELFIINRTYDKAVKLANRLNDDVHAFPFHLLEEIINRSDIIISAISVEKPIINKRTLKNENKQVFFDLGMPRNIDLSLSNLKNKTVYNVDQINELITSHNLQVEIIEDEIRQNIWTEIADYYKWQTELGVFPLINELRQKQMKHLNQVTQSLDNKLPNLKEKDKKKVNKHFKSLLNAMLKDPIINIKELSLADNAAEHMKLVRKIFDIETDKKYEVNGLDKESIIRVGTRGSHLAVAQTNIIIESLSKIFPNIKFEIVIISTQGDRDKNSKLKDIGGKGVFVKEIEKKLLDGEIDIAIHSLKDMSTKLVEGTTIASIPRRDAPFDSLLTLGYPSIESLPLNAKVGTGSLRRAKQLKRIRPDLIVVDIRGNLDTRIQKLVDNDLDAIVVATSGLIRSGFFSRNNELNLNHISLNQNDMIPAVGQGALAIQCRDNDQDIIEIVRTINDYETELLTRIEREYLAQLGVNCNFPVGAYASILENGEVSVIGMLASKISDTFIVEKVQSKNCVTANLGKELFEKVVKKGGDSILSENNIGV